MTKMVKKIVAMGAAVMMMASISAMGASAYTDLEKTERIALLTRVPQAASMLQHQQRTDRKNGRS